MWGEKINSFTDLHAWQASHKLVIEIFITFDKLPQYDALRSQIQRAALSITSNISEGFGRQSTKDKQHFYVMARGSAYEVQNQLIVARDTKRISGEKFNELAKLSLDSIRLLHGLMRFITKGANADS